MEKEDRLSSDDKKAQLHFCGRPIGTGGRASPGGIGPLFLCAWLAAAGFLFFPTGSSLGAELGRRHLESGLNTKFRYSEMSFHQYINHFRKVIAKTRWDLTSKNRIVVIDANTPFD